MMDNVVASICSSTSTQKNRSPPRRYNVKVHQHSFTIYLENMFVIVVVVINVMYKKNESHSHRNR